MDNVKSSNGKKTLKIAALFLLISCGILSLVLTLRAGQNNHSIVLPLLFIGWVLSPFIMLIIATLIFKRSSVIMQTIIYWLMIVIAPCSLLGLSGVLSPVGTKPAAVFLIVPFISWVIITVVLIIGTLVQRKKAGKR